MRASLIFLIFIALLSCEKKQTITLDKSGGTGTVNDKYDPPFPMDASNVKFYQNIEYGTHQRNKFDIFLPKSTQKTGIVIFIHGGAFVGGDKSFAYSTSKFKNIINGFLSKDIAFASINYRLLENNDEDGVLKSVNDSKKALQFIRHYADSFNINKNDVVLMGGSAGAGTSLWLALRDEMANTSMSQSIEGESTRVKGVVAIETQASYNLLEWSDNIFYEYQPQGFDFNTIKSLVSEPVVLQLYGIDNLNELQSPQIQTDRSVLSFLGQLTSDDPEIYMESASIDYVMPLNADDLYHHPLHAKILMDKAASVNVQTRTYLPKLNIDTRNGEDIIDFVVRKIGE